MDGALGLQVILGLTQVSLSRANCLSHQDAGVLDSRCIDAHCRKSMATRCISIACWRAADRLSKSQENQCFVGKQPFQQGSLHPALEVDVSGSRMPKTSLRASRQGCETQEAACATPRPAKRQGRCHAPHAVSIAESQSRAGATPKNLPPEMA